MTKWLLTVSQNGWEYSGSVLITAKEVRLLHDRRSVEADGILIEFDEEVGIVSPLKGRK